MQKNLLSQSSAQETEGLEARAMLAIGSLTFDGNVPQKYKDSAEQAKKWWNNRAFEFKDLDLKFSYRDLQASDFPGGPRSEGAVMSVKYPTNRIHIDTDPDNTHQTNGVTRWKMIAHEMGHLVGITQHNDEKGTLMYKAVGENTKLKLTNAERNKIKIS